MGVRYYYHILDFLYRGRDFQRFWVLGRSLQRTPYFSFISVLHFRESVLDFAEEEITYTLMKEHFYQALNETEHLEEMELREGNEYWIDHVSLPSILFWFIIGSWLGIIFSILLNAYDINMKIEAACL